MPRRYNLFNPLDSILILIKVIDAIASIPANAQAAQRRIDYENQRIERLRSLTQSDHLRREATRAKIIQEHNRIALLEIEIERRELELKKLRREMGEGDPFMPDDY